MERRIFTSIMSIAVSIVILVSSFILWQQFNNEEGKLIAESYGELPLSMKDNTYDTILYGDYIEKQDIIINYKNMNNINRKESFYLVIDRESTINEGDLSFTINDYLYNVNNLESKLINGYLCYYIEELNFNEYEEKELNIKFKKNTKINDDSYLIYDFQII